MKIEQVSIADIVPYEHNARNNKQAIDKVKESIRQFGFKVPIVLDKDNIIVCGHTRYEAAIKLGMKEVPCIIADDLTDEQIRAYRLADNKVAEFSTWDFDVLKEELTIIDIDMSDFGFDTGFLDEEPSLDELEQEKPEDEKLVVKVVFNTFNDWTDKEDEFRSMVENSNAYMVVGCKL